MGIDLRRGFLALFLALAASAAGAQWVVEGKGDSRRVVPTDADSAWELVKKTGREPVMSEAQFRQLADFQGKLILPGKDGNMTPPQLREVLMEAPVDDDTGVEPYIHVGWFGKCYMDAEDSGTCANLAAQCGYSSCSPHAAIQGLFGGCAGLLCSCTLADGSTFGDAVGKNEIGGSLACDKFIPFANRGGRDRESAEYNPYPPDFPLN